MIRLRVCDICGTVNFKENNYCTHCGNRFVPEHICPFCGHENPNYDDRCRKCGKQINPITIEDFDTLFSEYNENLLLNAQISNEQYNELLSNIFMRADYADIWGDSVKNKILSLAGVFVECKAKSRGHERGYIFLDNCVYYDDRLADSVQISTIIHELAHYFLFTIIESLLCSIFNVDTSSTLQSFVWYFVTLPEFRMVNEYCAHTVEGRFIPYGYQNYGSFNLLTRNSDTDDETLNGMMVLGNSFANEIIVYLEKYIDDELRSEIKIQYRKDQIEPSYESIVTETSQCFPLEIKNRVILNLLYDIFKEASKTETRKELESIKEDVALTD